MARYVKLEDIKAFPIRLNHYDREHGNLHFILGIESLMEYIDYLPQYEFGQDAKPVPGADDQRKEAGDARPEANSEVL